MPTIEFTTYDKRTTELWRPVLAKKVVPDWWKTMKVQEMVRGNKTQTIRSCPAMDDWLKSGWYICAKTDMQVKVNEDGRSMTDPNNPLHSPTHPAAQGGHNFTYLPKEDAPTKDAFKMRASLEYYYTTRLFMSISRPLSISEYSFCNMAGNHRYRYIQCEYG